MSPLAQLLQIKQTPEATPEAGRSLLGKIWARFVGILRSAKVQRRVRRIEIVERIALGNKQSVVLLRVDQREFMVGCCGDSVVLLAPPPAPLAAAETTPSIVVAKPVKAPAKRQSQAKAVKPKSGSRLKPSSKETVRPAATVISSAAQINLQESGKQTNTGSDTESSLDHRVPTKARLVKAFGRRA
jgi:flagellar biogenesis protein FliO